MNDKISRYKNSINFDDDVALIFLNMLERSGCKLPFETTPSSARRFVEENINPAIYDVLSSEKEADSLINGYAQKQIRGSTPNFPETYHSKVRNLVRYHFSGEIQHRKKERKTKNILMQISRLILFRKR